MLNDGKFFLHRRDSKAPTHKLWHSIQAGFPENERQAYFPSEVVVSEGSELVLVTKEKPHHLIVPKNDTVSRAITLDAASRIGFDVSKTVEADFNYGINGPDTIRVFVGNDVISSTNGYVEFLYESESGINLIQPCRIDFDPENILPIDTEGIYSSGKRIHFNREVFQFNQTQIETTKFDDAIQNPIVYRMENGVPTLQTREPKDAPYIFMPDDQASRIFYGLGIWKGNWLEHFRDFHKNAAVK